MNILVIAANGRTGTCVVRAAHKKGHKVMAFSREEIPKERLQEGVKVMLGDAMNLEAIAEAVQDQDVVISAIGHVKNSAENVQTAAMENLISAIKATNPKIKIVSLTGTGVRQVGDKITLIDRVLNLAIKIIDRPRVDDGIKHARALKNSKVNYVIIRVLKLTNGAKKSFSLKNRGPTKMLVSRSEVASAMVMAAESNEWDKQMPIIAKAN